MVGCGYQVFSGLAISCPSISSLSSPLTPPPLASPRPSRSPLIRPLRTSRIGFPTRKHLSPGTSRLRLCRSLPAQHDAQSHPSTHVDRRRYVRPARLSAALMPGDRGGSHTRPWPLPLPPTMSARTTIPTRAESSLCNTNPPRAQFSASSRAVSCGALRAWSTPALPASSPSSASTTVSRCST